VIFTMLLYIADISNMSKEVNLPNKLVNNSFITFYNTYIQAAQIKLNYFKQHFERGQSVLHKSFPFAPRLFQVKKKPGAKVGRFFAWLANIVLGTKVTHHFYQSENLANIKLVISKSIFANRHKLMAGIGFGPWLKGLTISLWASAKRCSSVSSYIIFEVLLRKLGSGYYNQVSFFFFLSLIWLLNLILTRVIEFSSTFKIV